MRAVVKYSAILSATLASSLTYWRDLALQAGFMVVVLVVFVQLWSTTYDLAGSDLIAGFSLRDIVWYLVLTETVMLSAPRVSQKIDQEVKSGELAYVLGRPYDYVLYQLATYWGEAALRAPLNLAVGATVALAVVGAPPASAASVFGAGIAVVLALTLNFALEATIGLTAFWFEDTHPFYWIYQKLAFSIGGMFLPLDLFPEWLNAVARLLPFAAVTYAPARLLVGFSWEGLAALVALQLAWLAAAGAAAALVYRSAVRRVNLNGG